MGEVWKARDTRLNRIVAIKRLKPQHTARFQQEARAIAALNHPHICQIYDIGPDYLVLEYVEGNPLRGPLRVEEAMQLAMQIASALVSAHQRGVFHRDLKPGNVLITQSGAKLLDFGLAKMVANSDTDTTKTIEGTVMARQRICRLSRHGANHSTNAQMCSVSGRFYTRCYLAHRHSLAGRWWTS